MTGRRLHRVTTLGGGAAGGVLVAMSLPPIGFWPLAWVGFAVLSLCLLGDGTWGRAGTGFAAGVGQYAIALWWVTQFQAGGYVALVAFGAALDAAAAMLVPSRRLRWVALGLPAAVTLAEWVRDRYPFGGFPLGSIEFGQIHSPLVTVTRVAGGLGLAYLTVLAGVAVAGLVLIASALLPLRGLTLRGSSVARRRPLRSALAWQAAATAGIAAAALGAWLGPDGGPPVGTVTAGLVQGGGPRGTRALYTSPEAVFERQMSASSQLRGPLDLVLWPEGMLHTVTDYRRSAGASELAGLARRLDTTVVAGVEQDVAPDRFTNEAVAWSPAGRVVGSYEKVHRVPFGEYVPGRHLVGRLFSLELVPRDAIAGHGPGILHTPAGPLGVMISYEVFFGGLARASVDAGGEILVVPTNTASYLGAQVPAQELAAAQLRARETGRSLLQATPTGYTAVVGSGGQVRRRSELGDESVIETVATLRSGKTIYVDGGCLIPLVVSLAAISLGAAVSRPGRRARAASRAPSATGLGPQGSEAPSG